MPAIRLAYFAENSNCSDSDSPFPFRSSDSTLALTEQAANASRCR